MNIRKEKVLKLAAQILWEHFHDDGQPEYHPPISAEDALWAGMATGYLMRVASDLKSEDRETETVEL